MTDANVIVGNCLEMKCKNDCGYVVSSMTYTSYGPARRTFPDECQRCGSELVEI